MPEQVSSSPRRRGSRAFSARNPVSARLARQAARGAGAGWHKCARLRPRLREDDERTCGNAGNGSRTAVEQFRHASYFVTARSFIFNPTGYIVNEIRSCGSSPSGVETSAMSKLASSMAITILISASAR